MPALAINGIILDGYLELSGTHRLAPELVGELRRSFGGSLREDVTGRKARWSLRTVALAQADVTALRGLLEGLGDAVTGSEYWTEQGQMGTTDLGFPDTPAGLYGDCFKCDDQDISFDLGWLLGSDWTVFYWWSSDDGATWHHRLQTSAGGKWQDGATSAADFGDVVVAAGVLTIQDAVTLPVSIDDVVILPFVVPSSWVADIYAEHSARAWTAPPSLRASGDLVASGPVTVRGFDRGSVVVPHARGGSWLINGEALEALLEEV